MKKFPPFMVPEASLPFSQEPTTGPYPKPDASTPHLYFPKIHFNIFPSIPMSSQVVHSFQVLGPKFCKQFSCLAYAVYANGYSI